MSEEAEQDLMNAALDVFPIHRARWIGLQTLISRECGVIVRFWFVTLAPSVITTALYFVIFGKILGGRIGSIHRFDYIQYIAPGLIILWVIPNSYGHTAGGLIGARIFRYIEELLASPLPDWIIMLGYVIGGMARGLLVATVTVGIALPFVHVSLYSIVVSIVVLLLTTLISALGGFITAMLAKDFDQMTVIQTLILTPLTYFGGVFNPVSSLPDWAQNLSLANPMFYMVNAFRYGFLGAADVSVGISMLMMSVLAVVLAVTAAKLMTSGSGMRQ